MVTIFVLLSLAVLMVATNAITIHLARARRQLWDDVTAALETSDS